VRFITEITKENISYTKAFVQSVELRHLDGVKGNFGVSDAEYIAISTTDTSTGLAESKSMGIITCRRVKLALSWTQPPCFVHCKIEECRILTIAKLKKSRTRNFNGSSITLCDNYSVICCHRY
jgi:hypothetical protein